MVASSIVNSNSSFLICYFTALLIPLSDRLSTLRFWFVVFHIRQFPLRLTMNIDCSQALAEVGNPTLSPCKSNPNIAIA